MKIEVSDKTRLIAGGISVALMIAALKLLHGSDLAMVIGAVCTLFNLALNSNVQPPKAEEKKQ